jgi:DNA-binding LacI/PurR family transcriptional regulator
MRSETGKRIKNAIAELQYRPSDVARQLKTGRTKTFGLLIPIVSNPFYGQFAVCVEQAARRQGYRVMLFNTFRDTNQERDVADELISFGVSGLIMGWGASGPDALASLSSSGAKIVALDMWTRNPASVEHSVAEIALDYKAAVSIAIDHLVSLGHQHICFVTGPGEARSKTERLEGFHEAIASHGLEPQVVVGKPLKTDQFGDADLAEMGRKSIGVVLRLPVRPTALVAFNDLIAGGLILGLQDVGLSVPRYMSVVGIDNAYVCRFMNPALTTIHQPAAEMAEAAVEMLVAKLEDEAELRAEQIFAPTLVPRDSTAPPRPPVVEL